MFGMAKKYPDKAWVDKVTGEVEHTPDMAILNPKEFQLVFIYDEMRYNHPQHNLVSESSVNIASAFTLKPFTLWKKKLGKETTAFALKPTGSVIERPCKIKGELYAVRPYQFPLLDTYKQNGLQYQRERVRVLIPHVVLDKETGSLIKETTALREAWMYIGISEYWEDQLDAGLFFEQIKQFEFGKLGPVASFTQREYTISTTSHQENIDVQPITSIAFKDYVHTNTNPSGLPSVPLVRRILRVG